MEVRDRGNARNQAVIVWNFGTGKCMYVRDLPVGLFAIETTLNSIAFASLKSAPNPVILMTRHTVVENTAGRYKYFYQAPYYSWSRRLSPPRP